jgi:hypothetical protein
MHMPAISARASIYATECKRRAPRLTVLPQGTRHPLLQHVARTGVRLRAPTRRKPVNNARVAGAGGAQALSHSLGGEDHSPCHGIQRRCCGHCPGPWRLSPRRQPRAATAPPRQRATCGAASAHALVALALGPETTLCHDTTGTAVVWGRVASGVCKFYAALPARSWLWLGNAGLAPLRTAYRASTDILKVTFFTVHQAVPYKVHLVYVSTSLQLYRTKVVGRTRLLHTHALSNRRSSII